MKDFECPAGDMACPYFKSGYCMMGTDAINECDEAYYYCGSDNEEED